MCSRSSSGTSLPRFSTNSFELMMRPSRTMNTCTPATVSSRNRPTTSASRLRVDTACCLSARPLMVSMRALMRAARSKSSSAAASCISPVNSSTNSRCWPDRNRSMRRTFSAYSSGVMRPQHAPGPKPTCASKHGRSTSQFRQRVFVAAFQLARHAPPFGARRGTQGAPRGARCPPCRGRRGCRCRVRSTWCRVGASRACT